MTAVAEREAGEAWPEADYATRPCSFSPDLLRGHVVLVSGAGGGIGRATSWLLARLGAHVVLAGRKVDKLDAVATELRTRGFACTPHALDVRDRASVDTLYDDVFSAEGRLDLVIHAAGGQFPQPAIEFSQKGWRAVLDTNLDGTFHMMQSAARHWRDRGAPGSLVNIVVSPRGLHHVAHTVAARAGVIAFSEAVAVEWAPLGIRVNCVAPGVIRTAGWAAYTPTVRARYPNANPLRRAGTPWDVAEACLFVGGPSGSFITGETLELTGGGHLWGEVWTTDKPAWFRDASRSLDVDDTTEGG
jgi:citronellol/citronellal dehydrogenase